MTIVFAHSWTELFVRIIGDYTLLCSYYGGCLSLNDEERLKKGSYLDSIIRCSFVSIEPPSLDISIILVLTISMSAAPEEYVPQRPKYQNPLVDRY